MQAFLTVTTKLDDPRFAALTFRKDIRISFFDGRLRGQSQRSAFRGGFYHIHRATQGVEPSPGLVNGTAGFDPADYCNVPVRVVFDYLGRTEKDSDWYGRTANIRVFVNRFEPSIETAKRMAQVEDDGYGDDEPSPFTPLTHDATGTDLRAPQQAALPAMDDATQAAFAAFMAQQQQAPQETKQPVGDELGLPV
jgi:hypothetical protein